jgi:uncharacterized protein YdeI (YjbR/CyaY-like superfamily)
MQLEMQIIRARNRAVWRRWLERHHDSSPGVWLKFYKKHTGKPSVTYPEALEEALCFGWIDSILKRINAECYMQRFTPRTNPKKWSPSNLIRMRRLIAEGKMTDSGLRVLGVPLDHAEVENTEVHARGQAAKQQEPIPEFFQSAVARNPKAAEFWRKLAPGYRRRYLGWVLQAKKEETRLRRLSEAVEYLEAGTKSLMK